MKKVSNALVTDDLISFLLFILIKRSFQITTFSRIELLK